MTSSQNPSPAGEPVPTEPRSAAGTQGKPPTSAAGRLPTTRAGAAWVAICVAGVVAVGLIIFIAQNTGDVGITFLWMHVQTPLSLALLIATVGGILVTAVLGMTRIVQLKKVLHRRPS